MGWTPVPDFEPMDVASIINDSANYILLLYFGEDREVRVGALGDVKLKNGTYAYCGSAKAGLWGRMRRHLSEPEKKRWHVDHITPFSSSRKIFWKQYKKDGECRTAEFLSDDHESVKGFGCSDCSCRSHLFYLGEKDLTS